MLFKRLTHAAAGLIDPPTLEGITYALRSRQLGAEAMLQSQFEPEEVHGLYESKIRVAKMLSKVVYYYPGIRGWIFRCHVQAFCEAMTEVFTGERSHRGVLFNPRNYLSLVLERLRATEEAPIRDGLHGKF